MARQNIRHNRQAKQLNPESGGIRTSNPQIDRHEGGDVRLPKRQRPPRASEKRRGG